MEHTPLVTVLVTTYNQEKYIAQALDSVLAQKTDFPFEIYVSEDCGTDGTRDILREYARRYPQIIRLNLREKNVGISRNWYEGLCAARGDYVWPGPTPPTRTTTPPAVRCRNIAIFSVPWRPAKNTSAISTILTPAAWREPSSRIGTASTTEA